MGEEKFAETGLVGECGYAVAGGVDEHGAGAVEDVASGYLGAGGAAGATDASVDAENGADADVYIDIAGAVVEGGEGDYVFAVVVAGLDDFLLFFGEDGAALATVGKGTDEADVGFYIEALLGFALDVGGVGGADNAAVEAGAVYVAVYDFAS